MPRGVPNHREIHSPDFIDHSEDGVLDFDTIRVSGLPGGDIQMMSEREFKDGIEYEAFMAEQLIVTIHTSSDKNAPKAVFVGVNGEGGWLPRGPKVRLARRFVERLARSQATSFRTQQNNDMNRDEAMDTMRSTAQDYSFSVLKDPNPKGEGWLRRVSAESR